MGPGRAAGGADVADDLTARDVFASFHGELAEMSVPRGQTETVGHDDHVAVVTGIRRRLDVAVSRRVHRLALLERDVQSLMETRLAGKGIVAAAEPSGDPSMRRPDRRRGRGQRFAPLDF